MLEKKSPKPPLPPSPRPPRPPSNTRGAGTGATRGGPAASSLPNSGSPEESHAVGPPASSLPRSASPEEPPAERCEKQRKVLRAARVGDPCPLRVLARGQLAALKQRRSASRQASRGPPDAATPAEPSSDARLGPLPGRKESRDAPAASKPRPPAAHSANGCSKTSAADGDVESFLVGPVPQHCLP